MRCQRRIDGIGRQQDGKPLIARFGIHAIAFAPTGQACSHERGKLRQCGNLVGDEKDFV